MFGEQEDWRIHVIAAAALMVVRLRFVDMSMKEHAHRLYAVEGGRTLLAHTGNCYMYSDGAWRPFQGVLSAGVLSRIMATLCWVERLFQTLPDHTARRKEDMIAAVAESVGDARKANDNW